MKINSNPFEGMRQAVESEATKAKEKIQGGAEAVAEKVKEVKEQSDIGCAPKVTLESTAKEAKAFLGFTGQASRTKMDKLLDNAPKAANFIPQEGTLLGDVMLGAREGADAGQKSGRQGAVDTHAQGPHAIAAAAGGLVGGLSGAIDGFNGHMNGASSDEIKKEARANGDYSGGIAGQRAMVLDNSAGENATYSKYKQYQADGGTKSYSDWVADSNYYGGNNTGGGPHSGSSITAPPPSNNNNNNNNTQPAPNSPNPANNNNNPGPTNPWPYATGEETVEDTEETTPEDETPTVVYGDPNKTQQTTYVDTSSMKSDDEAVNDLI